MDMRTLMEAISRHEALAIFAKAGVDASSLDAAALKKAHRQLAMKNHPDSAGGDENTMKMINAAYDVLSKTIGGSSSDRGSGPSFRDYETNSSTGYGKGGKQDYTNLYYFKSHIEELARATGEPVRIYTIWQFDGHFFRGCVSVKGCPAVFREMTKAMLEWEDKYFKRNAVFIATAHNEITLMWLDGTYLDKPVTLNFNVDGERGSQNPGNDQQFQRELPAILAKIADGGSEQPDMFGEIEGSGTVR